MPVGPNAIRGQQGGGGSGNIDGKQRGVPQFRVRFSMYFLERSRRVISSQVKESPKQAALEVLRPLQRLAVLDPCPSAGPKAAIGESFRGGG